MGAPRDRDKGVIPDADEIIGIVLKGVIPCAVWTVGMFAFWDRRRFYRLVAEQHPNEVDRLVASAQAETDSTPWPHRKWPQERVRMWRDPRWSRRQERAELVMGSLGLIATLVLLGLGLA